MPEPMIRPTIKDNPLTKVKFLCFSKDPAAPPACGFDADIGAPIRAYPFPAEDERGKRFEPNSNADDAEKDLLCGPSLPFAAAFSGSKGSSASRESFRDEGGPDEEDVDSVDVLPSGVEDAREANSRESRALFDEGGCNW